MTQPPLIARDFYEEMLFRGRGIPPEEQEAGSLYARTNSPADPNTAQRSHKSQEIYKPSPL